MLTPRRYVVRIYGGGNSRLAGILEDARTGAEIHFNGARELVSLLRSPDIPSSTSLQPRGNLPKSRSLDGKQRPKRNT